LFENSSTGSQFQERIHLGRFSSSKERILSKAGSPGSPIPHKFSEEDFNRQVLQFLGKGPL
jgi:hypothetical protein